MRVSDLAFSLAIAVGTAHAHESGAPFSSAILDPMAVHHAHIENEQRLNAALLQGFRSADGEIRRAWGSSVELAVTWTDDYRIGSEVFVPFSNTGLANTGYGIGDIEVWPIKYALINRRAIVIRCGKREKATLHFP